MLISESRDFIALSLRSSLTRVPTTAAYCCGGNLLLTSCRVFVLTDSLWKPHLGNHGVKLSKFLMRNAKQNTARCCRSEEGYRCMAGSGGWLNSQERTYLCSGSPLIIATHHQRNEATSTQVHGWGLWEPVWHVSRKLTLFYCSGRSLCHAKIQQRYIIWYEAVHQSYDTKKEILHQRNVDCFKEKQHFCFEGTI